MEAFHGKIVNISNHFKSTSGNLLWKWPLYDLLKLFDFRLYDILVFLNTIRLHCIPGKS